MNHSTRLEPPGLSPRAQTARPDGIRLLTDTALETNPFFDPAILEPAFSYLANRSVVYCSPAAPGSGLALGAMPVVPARGRYGPLPVPTPLTVWLHPYAVNGTPLIAGDDRDAAFEALFQSARQAANGAPALLFPMLSENGQLWPALRAFLESRGIRHEIISRTERAGLKGVRPGDKAAKLSSKASRQSIRKARNRLERLGRLEHRVARSLSDVHAALPLFLDLEANGWKGRRGTALRTIGHADFFTAAVMNLALEKRARIDLTLLDDEIIAATVSISSTLSDGVCWMPWKTAYDEAYRREAPGTVNLFELTQSLLTEADEKGEALFLDSLAGPQSVIASRLWPERWHFIDLLTELTIDSGKAFKTVLMAEKTRQHARQKAYAARQVMQDVQRCARAAMRGFRGA